MKTKSNLSTGKARAFSSMLLAACLFSACHSNRELMFRYTSMTEVTDTAFIKSHVDVHASIQETPALVKPDPFLAYKLDPKAEKELIRQLGKKASPEDLLKSLATPLVPADDPKPFLTETHKFTKRLVISVSNLGVSDANRIAKIRVTLSDPTNRVRFINCDKIVTLYQTITLGSYGSSNSTYGEADAGATYGYSGTKAGSNTKTNANGDSTNRSTSVTGSAGVNLSGKIGYTNQLTASSVYNQRTVALSGSFKDGSVSFYEEGATGLDLTGSIISDVTFEFVTPEVQTTTFYNFSALTDKKGKFNPGDSVKLRRNALAVPNLNPAAVYKLNLSFNAIYRQVVDSDNYIPEGYHRVKFYHGGNNLKDECLLIKAKDILPKKWGIRDMRSGRVIGIRIFTQAGEMIFDNYQKADDFLLWLLNTKDFDKGVTVGKYKICIDQTPMTLAQRSNLEITTF